MGRCKASVCSPLLGPLCLHLVPFLLLISRPGGFALPGLCLGLIHIFTQTLHTTCVQEVTPIHGHCGNLSSPRVTEPAYRRRHVLCSAVPGLLNYPLPFPVHLSGRRRGGERHRREVSVSLGPQTDIPCLGQITEAASFQELEPPVLTPCPMPGLNAHSSKKTQTTERTSPNVVLWMSDTFVRCISVLGFHETSPNLLIPN